MELIQKGGRWWFAVMGGLVVWLVSARPPRASPALLSVLWAALARAPFALRKGRGPAAALARSRNVGIKGMFVADGVVCGDGGSGGLVGVRPALLSPVPPLPSPLPRRGEGKLEADGVVCGDGGFGCLVRRPAVRHGHTPLASLRSLAPLSQRERGVGLLRGSPPAWASCCPGLLLKWGDGGVLELIG